MDTHINVVPQASFRNGALGCKIEDVGSRYLNIVTLTIKLITLVTQYGLELVHAELNQTRVSDPTAVIAIGCLTTLIS